MTLGWRLRQLTKMTQMIAILYRSEATIPAGSPADRQILAAARARNTAMDVTGFLHRESDVFYQWLEGPAEAVRQIFGSIAQDRRHRDVVKLSERPIAGRNFPSWSMARSETRDTSLFEWAAAAGVSLHAVRPDEILSFLLHSASRA